MEVTKEDREQFQRACEKIIDKERMRHGIGTLSEKTTHAVLKEYLVPKEEYHEIKCGRYVADIFWEGEIIEIQTANFNTLRRKLDAFLPQYEVTIVYPVPATKWLLWINEETGEVTKKRKSPKQGSCLQIFYELYKIKNYLKNPHLHFRIIRMDMEEYRLLNGWSRDKKRGSDRYDRIPIAIVDELMLAEVKDYEKLLPDGLPLEFTSRDFKEKSKLSLKQSQTALNVLTYLGTVERIGKKGQLILYKKANISR